MSNNPGQVPTPQVQPQPNQATSQVSDKTIDAFMAVDDNKKRDALSKMSEPTKQALLQGIHKRKGVSQPQAPILPTPKQPQPGVAQGTPQSFTSVGPSSIGPREPSYLERQKERFTQGAPTESILGRQSSAVNQPDDKPISLIKFEAGMTPKEREQHPVVTGIQEILSSMTSPENLALMAGSGGMGELPGMARATLPRLVSGYFTAQMLLGAYKEIPEFKQALDTGNDSEAKRIMTHIVGGTALAGLAARHAIKGEPPSSAPGSLLNSGIDVLKKRAIVAAASHETLKKDTDVFKNTIADSYQTAKNQGVGAVVSRIVKADQLDSQSKGLAGSTHAGNIDKVIDAIVKTKGAGDNYNNATVELPGTKIIKDAINLKVSKKGPLLSWDDLKDINQAAEFAKQAAYGKDAAVVGDFTAKLRNVMRGRAAQLGSDRLADHDEYVQTMKDLSTHKDGILSKLNNADTPLKFMNELGKESNRPDLDRLFQTLEKHGGLPSGYMDKFLADHKFITHFANATEGDTKLARLTNRLIAMKSHKVAGTTGLTAGATIGHLVGTATGIPLMPTFVGASFTAAFMADLMDKYNAAQQIREIGGPSGVTGDRPVPPSSSTSGPSTQQGPGGGTPPVVSPSSLPSGSPPSINFNDPKFGGTGTHPMGSPEWFAARKAARASVSPALAKLLPEAKDFIVETDSTGIKWAVDPKGVRVSIPKALPEAKVAEYAKAKLEEQVKAQGEIKAKSTPVEAKNDLTSQIKEFSDVIRDPKSSLEQREVARQMRRELRDKRRAFNKAELEDILGSMKSKIREAADKHYQESIPLQDALEKMTSRITKVPEEARGRTESVRKGMTKDTPEARKAKAAERIAARRAEASRTNIKASLEDQARQVAGKMDFQGKSNVELEEGLQTLFGENGKRFLKQFQALAKQQKWSEEVYRGYLEDTIDRRAKELAQRPNVPGLGTGPVQEKPRTLADAPTTNPKRRY